MTLDSISRQTARRYLLGRQGLWPGRRWSGKEGAATAIRTLGAVQIDPLVVVARSHDLVLQSRVEGYQPAQLDALLYQDRAFFDYGAILRIYPIEDLPLWRLHMRRARAWPRNLAIRTEFDTLFAGVRDALRSRGPLGHRDFSGGARVESYRARKDAGVVLWYLWITGELMTHGRRNFDRLYDFHEAIVPPHLNHEAPEAEAERAFARQALEAQGFCRAGAWRASFAWRCNRTVPVAEGKRLLTGLVDEGIAAAMRIEGEREPYYLPAAGLAQLAVLADGGMPAEWAPLGPTTTDEVTILAPLDNLLDRDRTRKLFDFDYVWEVYKPAAQRRWGYYVLPILYGEQIVGRLDPKLERTSGTLLIQSLWLEDEALAGDTAFAAALARGLARFARFHGANRIEGAAIRYPLLRAAVEGALVG